MKASAMRGLIGCISLITASLTSSVSAAPITPIFDEFGPFPAATFGGTGIPNNLVSSSVVDFGNGLEITFGLAATQRFGNDPVTGAGGVYEARTGANGSGPGTPGTQSTWNFSFYIASNQRNTALDTLGLRILYDFDPEKATDRDDLGVINLLPNPLLPNPNPALIEGSQNLTFGFLAANAFPFIEAPTFPEFDPFAVGEYSFAIGTGERDFVAINVNVSDVSDVPAPATLALFGLGLLGLTRRRNG